MRATVPMMTALVCASAARADAQTYELRPFHVQGATSVAVAAVTDTGLAAGRYTSPAQPNGAGFVGNRGAVQTMALLGPPNATFPLEYIPSPTGMNNRGTVVGTYLVGEQQWDFAWRDGAYIAYFSMSTDTQVSFPPYIGTNNRLSYNTYIGDGNFRAYSGTPAAQSLVPANGFPLVASINIHGEVAGQYDGFVGSIERQTVFTVATLRPGKPQTLLPPGAQSASGGWINDAGQVAGSFQDKAGVWHGFVFQAGSYTPFDLPVKPDTLTTQGIDQEGRVVGVYTKGRTQFAFIYTADGVTRLKRFSLADVVHVASSHFGKFLAISDTGTDGVARSWLAVPTP